MTQLAMPLRIAFSKRVPRQYRETLPKKKKVTEQKNMLKPAREKNPSSPNRGNFILIYLDNNIDLLAETLTIPEACSSLENRHS